MGWRIGWAWRCPRLLLRRFFGPLCRGRRGLKGECKPGSIPGPRTGARMACACPITEQLRIEDKTMTFVTEVEGDALEAMQDAWDDVWSFTRSELGGAPDWADYVNAEGELFTESELEDRFAEELDDYWEPVSVCGYEYAAGRALREIDPVAFRCGFLDWLDAQQGDGELRSIEGR